MTTTSARTGRSFPPVESIEQIIRDRVDHHHSAGIVAGVLDADGSRVAAYGDPGPGRPPLRAETVYEPMLGPMVQQQLADRPELLAKLST
jgi:hypothetical protein